MATWTIPKTDWVGGDTPTADNFFNKVEENTQYLYDAANVDLGGGFFDNAGFEVRQDGSYVDRWVAGAGTYIVPRGTTTPNNLSNYSAWYTGQSVTSGGFVEMFGQRFPANFASKLVGRSITVSAWVYIDDVSNVADVLLWHEAPSSADTWSALATKTSINVGASLSNGWNYITYTYTVPTTLLGNNVSNGYYIGFGYEGAGTDTITYGVSQPKVQFGSSATMFIPKSYTAELLECQRYLFKIESDSGTAYNILTMGAMGTTALRGVLVTPTEMRTTPSLVFTNLTGGALSARGAGGIVTLATTDFAVFQQVGNLVYLSVTKTGFTTAYTYMISMDDYQILLDARL